MESHECKHEADLAVVKSDVREIKTILGRVERTLSGNGSTGLVTKVEVNRMAILRSLAWLGGLTIIILGACGWAIQSGITHFIGQ